LKDEDGDVVLWTNFHRYAKGGRKVVVRSIYSDDEKRLRSVVKLLNYVFFDRYHISRLTEIRPEMLSSGNAKTVNYGLLLQEHAVSPHILRHWYSVKLTLYGEDVAPGYCVRHHSSKTECLDFTRFLLVLWCHPDRKVLTLQNQRFPVGKFCFIYFLIQTSKE